MIQSFYTWIWYPFSLYCYHLITVPGMRMFPPRWKLTGWRRALAWFAAAMVSGFLAQILRLGVLALLKITGWPDTFFFQQICHLAALGLVCGVFYKGSLVTKLLVINLALALANQLAFIYGTVMLMVLGPEYSVWMILLRDVLSFSAFGYFYHALRVNTVAGNLFLARRDQICLLAIVFLNFTLSCSARGFLTPLPATVFYVSGCLTTIAITFLLFRYAWEHQRAKEQQTLLQDMRLSQSALSQIQETAAQMREMRHELGNHFVYISSVLEQKQYDELASYLSTMETWQDALAQAVATANPVAPVAWNPDPRERESAAEPAAGRSVSVLASGQSAQQRHRGMPGYKRAGYPAADRPDEELSGLPAGKHGGSRRPEGQSGASLHQAR